MRITPKFLVRSAIVVVALFAVALPLGDHHHGLGRHSTFLADAGQAVFELFLVGVLILIVLVVVSLAQHARARSSRGAGSTGAQS